MNKKPEKVYDTWGYDSLGNIAVYRVDPKEAAVVSEQINEWHKDSIADELRKIRSEYDKMELLQTKDGILVYGADDMWRNWKGIRNVITDRIEQLVNTRI
jgi:hypothetical protein